MDDEAKLRFAIQSCLESEYEVITAENGKDALKKFHSSTPDLIVLDLSMPELDGAGVAAALQAELGARVPPIVVLTAHADSDRVIRMAELGAKSYFLKPVQMDELEKRIKDLLDPRYSQASLARLKQALKWAKTEAPHEALSKVFELLESDPLHPDLRLVAARLCLMVGELDRGRYHARVAAAAAKPPAGTQLVLALLEEEAGEIGAALFHATRAVEALEARSELGE